jgi:hypothetical protein
MDWIFTDEAHAWITKAFRTPAMMLYSIENDHTTHDYPDCWLCERFEYNAQNQGISFRERSRRELEYYGVEWDPDIIL